MKRKKDSNGFTLIELIISVVVLGVIVAMAAPQFDSIVPRLKFKSASRDLVSDMRLIRSLAIAQRAQYGINFTNCFVEGFEEDSPDNYIVFKDKINLPALTFDAGDSVIKTVNIDPNLSIPSCSFTSYTIIFKPDGSASSTGTVSVRFNQRNELANIDVLASTGRVKLTYP